MRPLLHFVALAAMLFTLVHGFTPVGRGNDSRVVDLLRSEIVAARLAWRARTGREPTPGELSGSLQPAIDEEILWREARRIGLDRTDPIVRRRLVDNMRFVGADEHASDAELLREAFALGMERTDVLVRRRLVQAIEQRIESSARASLPSERELEDHIARNPALFRRPKRVRFAHVFFEGGGGDVEKRAARLHDELAASGAAPEDASRLGDPFLLGSRFGPASAREIAAAFGPGFSAEIISLAPGRWFGPIRSGYGVHLVRVEEAFPPHRPALSEVRDKALLSLLAEREKEALQKALRALRERYEIRTAGLPGLAARLR